MARRAARGQMSKTLWVPSDLIQRCLADARVGHQMRVAAGGTLYRQGEIGHDFFLILSGQVRISALGDDGDEVLFDVVDVGGLCGEGAAIDGLPRFSTATATTGVTVLRIDARRLRTIFTADPDLMLAFFRVTALKQRMLAFRLSQIGRSSAEKRIVDLLRYILRSMPDEERDGSLSLTHEQIATLIGASRVTVTRALNKLRAARIVATGGGRVRLIAPE